VFLPPFLTVVILIKKATISDAQNGYFFLDELETSVQQVTLRIRTFMQLDAGDECERKNPIMM
jgi:hypothetical protein